jgi:TPR repeat protein
MEPQLTGGGDYATALRMWRPLADQGSAIAQFNLGLMYENGQAVPRDYAAAANWYRKAADQGNASAQANLGFMYANGEGVPRDYAAAASWYRKAAERAPDRDPVRPLTPKEIEAWIRKNKEAPSDPCYFLERFNNLREQAAAADRAVAEFKAKNNIVTAGGKLINDQRLTEINSHLAAARARTSEAQARLNQIEGILRDQETSGTIDATVLRHVIQPNNHDAAGTVS